jgi:hypothetical protein
MAQKFATPASLALALAQYKSKVLVLGGSTVSVATHNQWGKPVCMGAQPVQAGHAQALLDWAAEVGVKVRVVETPPTRRELARQAPAKGSTVVKVLPALRRPVAAFEPVTMPEPVPAEVGKVLEWLAQDDPKPAPVEVQVDLTPKLKEAAL